MTLFLLRVTWEKFKGWPQFSWFLFITSVRVGLFQTSGLIYVYVILCFEIANIQTHFICINSNQEANLKEAIFYQYTQRKSVNLRPKVANNNKRRDREGRLSWGWTYCSLAVYSSSTGSGLYYTGWPPGTGRIWDGSYSACVGGSAILNKRVVHKNAMFSRPLLHGY